MDHNEFERKIFEIISDVPPGKVITYGQIAMLAGYPRNSRLVGRILSHCTKGVWPCYRVVNAAGRCAGLASAGAAAGRFGRGLPPARCGRCTQGAAVNSPYQARFTISPSQGQ